MSFIRPEFRTSLVQQITDDILYSRSNFFYFLGKLDPWPSEYNIPNPPINSYQEDVTIRNNLLYMRRLAPTDVSMVIHNYTWTPGNVYDQWDHTREMEARPFYVVTDEYNVYKCLNNNFGAVSTVKPTGTSLGIINTSDGYVWKYMYNVPVTKRAKFYSLAQIPVQRALTDSFYSRGAVEDVVINNGGTGYSSAPATTLYVESPSGTGTTAVIELAITDGVVTDVTIIEPGSNYVSAPNVVVASPAIGTTAVIELTITDGSVDGFTIVEGGSGYISSPAATVEAPRIQATAAAYVNGITGEIDSVEITNPGAGYTSTPTITVLGDGSNKYVGNTTAVVDGFIFNGRLDRLAIVDPGVNYIADLETTISAQGDGTGAVFYPKIENGAITGVVIANAGINYTYINLEVISSSGQGASIDGIVGASDFLSDQSMVEQAAIRGAIYAAIVTEPGQGYTSTTTVTIEGDGTGATAHAVLDGDSIKHIVIDSYGSNYTYANVIISDVNRLEPNSFINATAYATLPPINGHGYDAVKELYGNTLALSVAIKDDDALSAISQDYRQFGLIRNPQTTNTKQLIRAERNYIVIEVTVDNTTNLNNDDVIVNNNKRYRVVKIDNNNLLLQQLNSIYTTPSGFFTKENTINHYTIMSVNSTPTADKYSGDLMYVSNTSPFVPSPLQSFVVRTYITF